MDLPEGYVPTEDEEYMNAAQVKYFRRRLLEWKDQLLAESVETLEHLQDSTRKPDINDSATDEMQRTLELRTRDRYRKLVDKINMALVRIENGKYGYCDDTGEEIGIKRLLARPVATLCIEAQEKHENFERQHSEEDDV